MFKNYVKIALLVSLMIGQVAIAGKNTPNGTTTKSPATLAMYKALKDRSPKDLSTALKNGADVNDADKYSTALGTALNNNFGAQSIVGRKNFDANKRDNTAEGMTPLMLAALKFNEPVMYALVKKGADITAVTKKSGKSIIELVKAAQAQQLKSVRKMLALDVKAENAEVEATEITQI